MAVFGFMNNLYRVLFTIVVGYIACITITKLLSPYLSDFLSTLIFYFLALVIGIYLNRGACRTCCD